jgi:hypothetical protein
MDREDRKMALINCIECGREFSDKAAACPQCAAPINATHSDRGQSGQQKFERHLIEIRSLNEIVIQAPAQDVFDHVREILISMGASIEVSTTPLSICTSVKVDESSVSENVCVVFEIPDSDTTILKIGPPLGHNHASLASDTAIRSVASKILETDRLHLPQQSPSYRVPETRSHSVDHSNGSSKAPIAFAIVAILIAVFVLAIVGYDWSKSSKRETSQQTASQQENTRAITNSRDSSSSNRVSNLVNEASELLNHITGSHCAILELQVRGEPTSREVRRIDVSANGRFVASTMQIWNYFGPSRSGWKEVSRGQLAVGQGRWGDTGQVYFVASDSKGGANALLTPTLAVTKGERAIRMFHGVKGLGLAQDCTRFE